MWSAAIRSRLEIRGLRPLPFCSLRLNLSPMSGSATRTAAHWGRTAGRIALEWAIFFLAAIWITWPLAAHWTTSLPLGCEDEPVVPLLNLWTQWWNIDRIGHGYA